MTVFLILYECALFSSIVPPVYFPFELVLPVNEGGECERGKHDSAPKRVHCSLGEEPILRHSDFSAVPDTGDNIPALSEYTHRFFRRECWQG